MAPKEVGKTERSWGAWHPAGHADPSPRVAEGTPGVSSRSRHLGAVQVIEAWGDAVEIERRPLIVGAHTVDLVFVLRGTLTFFDRGEWVRPAGSVLIAPNGLPQRLRFADQSRIVITRIPRNQFVLAPTGRVSTHRDLNEVERALQSLLLRSVRGELASGSAQYRADEREVIELASAVVRQRQGGAWQGGAWQQGASPSAQPVLRERALGIIVKYAASVSLTPPQIARELGVSLRHLQAVFASSGSSVAAELRRERVRLAYAMLSDAAYDGHGMDAIAEAAGFGSGVTMRRALRDTFQQSPKQLRRARSVHLAVPQVQPGELRHALSAPSLVMS